MTPLEPFLADLCKVHNLSSAAVHFYPGLHETHRYSITVHWSGHSNSDNPCVVGHGATLQDAASDAILMMIADRTPHETPALEAAQ